MTDLQIREWIATGADVATILGVLGLGGVFIEGRAWWRNYWTFCWIKHERTYSNEDPFSELTDPVNAQIWSETRGQRFHYQLIRLIPLYKQTQKDQRMARIKEAD